MSMDDPLEIYTKLHTQNKKKGTHHRRDWYISLIILHATSKNINADTNGFLFDEVLESRFLLPQRS